MLLLALINMLLLSITPPVFAADTNQIQIEKYYFRNEPLQYQKNRLYVLLKSDGTDYEGDVTVIYTINGNDTVLISKRPITIIGNDHTGVFADVTFPVSGEFSLKVVTTQENSPQQTIVPTTDQKVTIQADTDKDGIANPVDTDDDNDGLTDDQESTIGTSPTMPDTDGDGTTDRLDIFPLNKNENIDTDSDGSGNNADPDDDNDGILDTQEKVLGTNPLDADTDNDGLSDKVEAENATNPLKTDTDGDGASDSTDISPLDPTQAKATDNDDIPDGVEDTNGLDKTDKSDAKLDNDHDGLSNIDEVLKYHTNPSNADTDQDGLPDNAEIRNELNPLDKSDAQQDNDHDGINNGDEVKKYLNPNNPSTYGISDKVSTMIINPTFPSLLLTGLLLGFIVLRKKSNTHQE